MTDPDRPPGLLYSPELFARGVPHAFTTRLGGSSPPPFDSLNFGNPSDLPADRRDPRERIARHWGLVLGALGATGRELVEVHQVHAGDVLTVRAGAPAHARTPQGSSTRADAIVTDDPARAIAVRVADCAPVLLASGDGRCVAAVHAGWKGVIAGVAPAAVRAMRAIGREADVACIGPCIGPGALEVGPEVAQVYRTTFAGSPALDRIVRPGAGDRSFIDLRAALREQLTREGVGAIDDVDLCTHARADLFFSHRRERGITGRMAAIITPAP